MKGWVKAGIGLGVTAVAAYGIYKGVKLLRFSHQLDSSISARVHSIDFSKIVIGIDALLKNPTRAELNITQPFVQLTYKGNKITSSQPSDKLIQIKAFNQTPLTILLPISYVGSIGTTIALVKALKDKTQKVQIVVNIFTYIVTGLKGQVKQGLSDYNKGDYSLIAYTPTGTTLTL